MWGGAGGVWRAQSHKCSQEVLEIPFINTASYRKSLKAQINHFPHAYVYINSTGLEDLIRSMMCLFTVVPKTSYLINSNFFLSYSLVLLSAIKKSVSLHPFPEVTNLPRPVHPDK